jgi:hypothetical protein
MGIALAGSGFLLLGFITLSRGALITSIVLVVLGPDLAVAAASGHIRSLDE